MVFFTCVIVVIVLYYLQADGLIFVTIIAVIAELINLLMTQTLTKSVEKQTRKKFVKIINVYKTKIAAQKKSLREFEVLQEESIRKLHNANLKIRDYEEKSADKQNLQTSNNGVKEKKTSGVSEVPEKKEPKPKEFIDLPAGSNRKQLPI